jgi:hypothetical protein
MTPAERKNTPVEVPSFPSQKELCDPIHSKASEKLMTLVGLEDGLQHADNCGELSLGWVHTIPGLMPKTHISDEGIELGLKAITLDLHTESTICGECGELWFTGHEQVCQGGPRDRVRRHDKIRDAITEALERDGNSVEKEQYLQPTTNLVRTDFTIVVTRSETVRSSQQPREEVHYDLSIVAPTGRNIRPKLRKMVLEENNRVKQMIAFLHKEVLPEREKAKKIHYNAENNKVAVGVKRIDVVPILMTSGGTIHKDMSTLLGSLRKQTRYFLKQRLSIILLEARKGCKWRKYIV